MPDVYIDGILQPGISIRETIIYKPIYFGQKDLSATGEGFEKDLVEKMQQVLDFANKEREKITQKGIKHSQQFTWEKAASQTLEVYNKNLGI